MHHPLRVSEIHRLTTKSVVLTFEVPETLTGVFQYEAGQYLSLEETLEGETVRRSYSICSAPSEKEATSGDQANSKRALFQLCKSTGPPREVSFQ